MKLYVAAKTHEFMRARAIMKAARDAGHTITQDWTQAVEHHGVEQEAVPPTDEQRGVYAEKDLRGVLCCEHYIGLWHPDIKGTLIEFGAAAAFRIPAWMVGVPEEQQHLVFLHLPTVTLIDTDEQAIERLQALYVPSR